MTEYPSPDEQMRDAMHEMAQHRIASFTVDRRGWSRRQWTDDAATLMDDLHGSVTSLANGHVLALIGELLDARQQLDQVRAIAGGSILIPPPALRQILDAAPADETGGDGQ